MSLARTLLKCFKPFLDAWLFPDYSFLAWSNWPNRLLESQFWMIIASFRDLCVSQSSMPSNSGGELSYFASLQTFVFHTVGKTGFSTCLSKKSQKRSLCAKLDLSFSTIQLFFLERLNFSFWLKGEVWVYSCILFKGTSKGEACWF